MPIWMEMKVLITYSYTHGLQGLLYYLSLNGHGRTLAQAIHLHALLEDMETPQRDATNVHLVSYWFLMFSWIKANKVLTLTSTSLGNRNMYVVASL